MGIVSHIAEGALNLRSCCVVCAVDAIWNCASAGGAGVGVEIMLCIAGVAGRWGCACGAELSGAVGVDLGNVGTSFTGNKAEQEDQSDKHVDVLIKFIQ